MYTKQPKGFTLIEVMVVVVITGVLAAVAGSKLFGSVAKAKASELTVNAGTYVKLASASAMEQGSIGTWSTIGYTAPGNDGQTNNFKYCQGQISKTKIKTSELGEGMIGWEAINTTRLNHCAKYNWWTISIAEDDDLQLLFSHIVSSPKCSHIAREFTAGNTSGVNCTVPGQFAKLTSTDVGYTMTMDNVRQGGWRGNSHQEGASWLNESQQSDNSAYYSIVSTYNENDPTGRGFFTLEANSVYTFTIQNPGSEVLQTDVRIYTPETATDDSKDYAVMCGSTTKRTTDNVDNYAVSNADWAFNTYMWSRTGENMTPNQNTKYATEAVQQKYNSYYEGIDVVAVYDKSSGTTTFTITTGNSQAYFGANIINTTHGLTKGSPTEARTAIENAVKEAKLEKVGESDGSKTAKQIEAERLAQQKEPQNK